MDEKVHIITMITPENETLKFNIEGFELAYDFINICAVNGYYVKLDEVVDNDDCS